MNNKKALTVNTLVEVLKRYDINIPVIINGEAGVKIYTINLDQKIILVLETEKYSSQFPNRDVERSLGEYREPPVKVKRISERVTISIDTADCFINSIENFKKSILEKYNVELSNSEIEFDSEQCHDYDHGEYIETSIGATFNVHNENYEKEYEEWRAWCEENDKHTAKQLKHKESQKAIAQAKKDYKLQHRLAREAAKKMGQS
jgi:hypothetical protein